VELGGDIVKRRILSIILALVMVLPMVAPMSVNAADTQVIAFSEGDIWEFRNVLNVPHSVSFSQSFTGGSGFGFIIYSSNGDQLNTGDTRTGLSQLRDIEIPGGGKLVVELRSLPSNPSNRFRFNANVNPNIISAQRLVTPVFHTTTFSANTPAMLTNNGAGRTRLNWRFLGSWPNANVTVEVFDAGGASVTRRANDRNLFSFGIDAGQRIVITTPFAGNVEIWGDHAAFGSQPYRLTIDGQRSFPPGLEQDLPQTTTPQIPTPDFSDPGEWGFTPIDELDALILAEITEETLAMITRSGNIRPFSEFNRAYHVSLAGQLREPSRGEFRRAYYDVLVGLIFNDRNLALSHVENTSTLELWPIVGTPYKIISSFMERNNIDGRRLDPDQVVFLMDMYHHAELVDNTMQEAIVMILRDFISEAELRQHQTAIDFLLTDNNLALYVAKEGLDEFVLSVILSGAQKASLEAIGALASYASWDRNFAGGARVSVQALQNVRSVIWRIWDAEIAEGNRNGITTDRLLTLHNLFTISRYLVVEQNSWSAVILDGGLLNMVNFGSDSRWARDVWLQDDLHYIRLIQSPANYPLFTQFNHVGDNAQSPQRIIRLYNDGRFILRSGWGTSRSTIERGTFRISDDGNTITLNGTNRNHQFTISPGVNNSQLLISGNDTYARILHGIPAEMIQWITTLQ